MSNAPAKRISSSNLQAVKPHRCPIPGCNLTYARNILGWHTHVGKLEAHPFYHPDIQDVTARQEIFKQEFPEFFAHTKAHTSARPSTIPPSGTKVSLPTTEPMTREDMKALFREVLREAIEKL